MAGSSSSPVFQWGDKEAGTDSSYESLCYNGVWYNLYDCVFCKSGGKRPFVGKLMRLYEDGLGVRKVRIRWFFRPHELPLSVFKNLPNLVENPKELFIAVGNVKGVENDNVVEVIRGKATVLCTAKCGNNLVPSQLHVDDAHHFFSRAFDVSREKIVKLVNIENKFLVQKFFNKPEWLPIIPSAECEEQSSITSEGRKSSSSMMDVELDGKRPLLSRTLSLESIGTQLKKQKSY